MKTPEESNAEAVTPNVLRWAGVAALLRIGLAGLEYYTEFGFRHSGWLGLVACGLVGALYAADVRRSTGDAAWHGGMVGGIGAFLGTALSAAMAVHPASALLGGTLAGIATGAIGGVAAHAITGTDPRWQAEDAGPS